MQFWHKNISLIRPDVAGALAGLADQILFAQIVDDDGRQHLECYFRNSNPEETEYFNQSLFEAIGSRVELATTLPNAHSR
jgi:hypothetical protein